ncbi:MAG: acyl--CoA ligase [Actinobacteria bacterium]|nr:acyl--CoA ligase [Actinomycetota bacterium]
MSGELRVQREPWRGNELLSYPERPASIVHILDDVVRAHGATEGLVDAHGRCTYDEFAMRVAGTAAALADRGLGRGAALGVVSPNSVDLAVLVFACAAAGVLMVGLSERGAPPRWARLLRTAGASAVAAAPGHHAAATSAAAAADLAEPAVMDLAELTRDRTLPWSFVRPDEGDTYAVVGTAGTTGPPKASRVIHRCSVHSALSYRSVLGLTSRDRTAVLFPLTYISALHAHVLPMMLAGGTSVLTTASRAHRFCDVLADEQITWMYTVPSFWLALLRTDRFSGIHLPHLRLAAFGGSAFPPDALGEIRRRFPEVALHNIYGLSETHSPATILRDDEFADRPTSVGRALPCMEARVVDATGAVVTTGDDGQLQLRGSLVTTGYLGDAGATAAAFVDDGWFATGDQARFDAEGYVWLLGRRHDLIIRGGFNIAPVEVEQALRHHPGIADAAVFGVSDGIGDRAVACAIVRDDPALRPRAVRAWVRTQVGDYAVPRHVHFVDDIPLTAIGKIDRGALAERLPGSPRRRRRHRRPGDTADHVEERARFGPPRSGTLMPP